VWLTDLGMTAKVRPCLVLSVRPGPADRVLFALVPHTTSLHGTAYEVTVPAPFLKPGAFDAQGLVTVPRPRLIRRLGVLSPVELAPVEAAVRAWLGL
jgi:mRNA interferase MazF